MDYEGLLRMLDNGVRSGRLIANLHESGEIIYYTDSQATPDRLRNSLSVSEIHRIRRTQNVQSQ